MAVLNARNPSPGKPVAILICRDLARNKYLYLMILPVIAYYVIFCYWPMYGALIAFKDYRPGIDLFQAKWIGLKNFADFFNSVYFWRVIRNTLLINVYSLIFGFPIPILLAVSLREINGKYAKKTFQTFTYLPYFVSTVIICGIITDFTSTTGVVFKVLKQLGYSENYAILLNPAYFRSIYVISDIWQGAGWSSIIYLSAISAINPELYEAARIDGANRFQQILHVTLAGIVPTIMLMLILQLGSIMSVGFEKVFLLYRPATYETSDVISTFVYRKGLNEGQFGFSTAVGLFNSVVNVIMLIIANYISRKFTQNSLF